MQDRHPSHTFMMLLLSSLLLGSCSSLTQATTSIILGRWQRVGQPTIGEPTVLMEEYVEFREAGVLVSLLFDEGPVKFWMISTAERYSFPDQGHIQVSGVCWQGWRRFDCSRVYRFELQSDTLKVFDEQRTDRRVEYQRIGALSPNLPPTLAPPFPSPTP